MSDDTQEKFNRDRPLRVNYYLHEIVDQLKMRILQRQLEESANDPCITGRLQEEINTLSSLVEHANAFFDVKIHQFEHAAIPNLQACLSEDRKEAERVIDLMLADLSVYNHRNILL
jgi:hypothetical protein